MDLKFLGITDIVIVLLFLVFIFVGAKKGFLKKFVSLASGLVGLLLALYFCQDFSQLLISRNIIYPNIYDNIFNNVSQIVSANPGSDVATILNGLGLPQVLCDYIAGLIGNVDFNQIAQSISTQIAKIFMVVISFLLLFVIIWVGVFLLKIIIGILRKFAIIKFIDGFLGVIFYGIMGIVTIYILLFVVSIAMQIPQAQTFNDFMIVDMQLQTDAFRLSKYFYENNILINLLKIFF